MKNTMKKISLFIIGLLALVYIAGLVVFSLYTYPNTYINGSNKSLTSRSTLFDLSKDSFELDIVDGDNKPHRLNSNDIGYQRTVVGKPQDNANTFLWPLEVFKSHNYDLEVRSNYDKSKLNTFIADNKFLDNMVAPQDARIDYDEQEQKFVLVDEVEGSTLDKNNLEKSIIETLDAGASELQLKEIYEKPSVTSESEDLLAEFNKVNDIAKFKYDFDFVDYVVSLTGKELIDMYDEEDNQLVFNRDKARSWVARLARETDTYGKDREFEATDIGTITVKGGIYGFLMAVDSTTNNLVQMIEEGTDGEVDIEYLVEGPYREKDDIKGTYVELDISRQHMWFYKDGELIMDSDVVTGNMINKDSMTPTGLNKIWSKSRNKVLKGTNPNTGQSYEYPTEYFMPMGWTDSGFHDTYTRTNYGGDIYLTSGSSACVNMPLEKAKFLYENVDVETPVFVYESVGDVSPTELERQIFYRTGEWPEA